MRYPNIWRNATLIPAAEAGISWTKREMISLNRWEAKIDESRIDLLMKNILDKLQASYSV